MNLIINEKLLFIHIIITKENILGKEKEKWKIGDFMKFDLFRWLLNAKILKKWKIELFKDKYLVLIRTKFFKWEILSWNDSKEHYHGEYCMFSTYEDAKKVAIYCASKDSLSKWYM